MRRRRNAQATVEREIAGAFSIRRLGGSRRGFGRTIALRGLNRPLIFPAPSVLVPPYQSTHRPTSYFRINAGAIVLTNRKPMHRLSRSDFVQVLFWGAAPVVPGDAPLFHYRIREGLPTILQPLLALCCPGSPRPEPQPFWPRATLVIT